MTIIWTITILIVAGSVVLAILTIRDYRRASQR
jgi:hypothetical protein